jgi:hypothetical protein
LTRWLRAPAGWLTEKEKRRGLAAPWRAVLAAPGRRGRVVVARAGERLVEMAKPRVADRRGRGPLGVASPAASVASSSSAHWPEKAQT